MSILGLYINCTYIDDNKKFNTTSANRGGMNVENNIERSKTDQATEVHREGTMYLFFFIPRRKELKKLIKKQMNRVEKETCIFEYDRLVYNKSTFPLKIPTKMNK